MRSNRRTVTVQAKTLDRALMQAASELGTVADNVNYKIISQTEGGFLSFLGSKRVEISAWKENSRDSAPRRTTTESATEVEEALPELTPEVLDELIEDLRSFCGGICSYLAHEDEVEVTAKLRDDRLILDINHDYLTKQITRNSKIAESMEHILRKKPRHLKRELPFRIFVDVRGLRMQREHELIDMAQDLSMKVHENQKPIVLNYKSSYDRKIIHMALDKDDRVYTKSIGSGPNRKLMILPSRESGESEQAMQ